jgi:hypothetical protein
MKKIRHFKLRAFIVCLALLIGLGFVTHVVAQEGIERSYLIDLDRKTATYQEISKELALIRLR